MGAVAAGTSDQTNPGAFLEGKEGREGGIAELLRQKFPKFPCLPSFQCLFKRDAAKNWCHST